MKGSIMDKLIVSGVLALAVQAVSAAPSFVLPDRLYAVPGRECAVYFTSVYSSVTPNNYAYEAQSEVGRAYAERWSWTPKRGDAGREVKLILRAWSDEGCVAAVTTTVEVASAPRNPERKTRLALFADSLTNSNYQDELFKVLRSDGFSGYTPVGSRRFKREGAVRHDGFGGYDCKAFLSYYCISEDEFERVQDAAEREQLALLGVPRKIISQWQRELLKSPLIRVEKGRKIVDVPMWIRRTGEDAPPDVVLIQLGVNSIFGKRGTSAQMREDIRSRVIPEFRSFIATLRPHMPKAVFGITTQPLGCGQDGFAANYGARSGEVQHRVTMFVLNEELEKMVRDFNDPLVELVPLAHAVDPKTGFPRRDEPAHSRTKTNQLRWSNALHPTQSGGFQMADALAAWYECRWNSWNVSKSDISPVLGRSCSQGTFKDGREVLAR
jgi:lysophospholipase L1-like esterase